MNESPTSMTIFMDRHDIPGVTAIDVAEAHQKDLLVQHKYNCKALTYWFDEEQGMAFCLLEAPDKAAVQKLHEHAHGLVPNQILEVEPGIVQSFLGRIKDPDDQEKSGAAIINDPAFRSIMLVHFNPSYSRMDKQGLQLRNGFKSDFRNALQEHKGSEVEQANNVFMASFSSVNQSISCALSVQRMYSRPSLAHQKYRLQIGISTGVPVTDEAGFFGKTIKLASYLGLIARPGRIVLSAGVGNLYRNNICGFSDTELISALNQQEENFISQVMEVMETCACSPSFDVQEFGSSMGMSKSQLYRKMISITGYSPNDFTREYRLRTAYKMIDQKEGNISEIAHECGFNSLSYFSKCFMERFDISPSDYAKLHS